MGTTYRFRGLTVPAVVAATVLAVAASGALSGVSSADARSAAKMERFRGWPLFTSVTAMSPGSALMVGLVYAPREAMTQHWDGVDWTYASPHGGKGGALLGVDSLSENDAWAVGYSGAVVLTEHWNGDRWQVVPSHGPGPIYSPDLVDVAMIKPRNVWAVGRYDCGDGCQAQPLVMHWDGTAWTTLADPFTGGTLDTVDAVSSDDVWTSGLYSGGMWHWDGTTWAEFPILVGDRRAIGVVSPNDAWVVGGLADPTIGHWDGTSWTPVDSPDLGEHALLMDVAALSKKDVWAVGYTTVAGDAHRALIEHWDGHSWAVVPCPHSRQTYDKLTAIGASSPDDVWAVGTFGTDSQGTNGKRFALHWDGSTWTRYHP